MKRRLKMVRMLRWPSKNLLSWFYLILEMIRKKKKDGILIKVMRNLKTKSVVNK